MRTKLFLLVSVLLMATLISACGGVALAQTPQAEQTPPQRTITVPSSTSSWATSRPTSSVTGRRAAPWLAAS